MKRTEHTQKWLDALRSGKYAQTRGKLTDGNGYCCLGVAGCVIGMTDARLSRNAKDAYVAIGRAVDMDAIKRSLCIEMNDSEKKTFPEIADEIEKMLDAPI